MGQSPMQCISRGFRQHCIKKVRCNFVLKLLKQYCTGQNPMQCCPRGSTKHCTGKNLFQFCLNILGRTMPWSKLYAMLSERLQTTLPRKNPGTTLHKKYSMQCCTGVSKQHFTGKNPGNVVETTSGHCVYINILGLTRQKKKLSFLYYENRLIS